MRAFISAFSGRSDQAGCWPLSDGLRGQLHHRNDIGVYWRGCLRLPLCLADSTFVVDNIRCQHSPPR